MKKLISIILACGMMTASFASCHKKTESSVVTGKYVDIDKQKGDSAEEALREVYKLIYASNGGDGFYLYYYPQVAIDALMANGEYEDLVKKYNEGKNAYLQVADNIPEIKTIDETVEFGEKELIAAGRYFEAAAMQQADGVDTSGIKAVEGCEFKMTIYNEGRNEVSDTECMVRLEGEGWKLIPVSLEMLMANYDDEGYAKRQEMLAEEASKEAASKENNN